MTQITQQPLYDVLPVGQQIIFTVNETSAVQNKFNVKYVASVYVDNFPVSQNDINTGNHLVATFKTTPNGAGRGIFDLRSLLESYVSSDNTGFGGASSGNRSEYKGVLYSSNTPHPIHLIDKFCGNTNAARWFRVNFSVEGSATAIAPVLTLSNSTVSSVDFVFFNGVLQRSDYLTQGILNGSGELEAGNRYGYDLEKNLLYPGLNPAYGKGRFLTNAPTTQYANINDYGTFAFLTFLPTSSTTNRMKWVEFKYYSSAGVLLGTDLKDAKYGNGFFTDLQSRANSKLGYVGAFPGNLQNISGTFKTLVAAGTIQGGYYTVTPKNASSDYGETYTINLNCPNLKGFESIRLCWLNQWGVWDYYTFTQKSIRTTSTNRTTYTQMSGTWNSDSYQISGYKGGKKNFRVNSLEKIRVNTDFVSEDDAVWFEELVNSPEVYILNGYDSTETAPYNTMTGKYVEPVLVTTSSYTRKTIANDKLMQYTFELERNKDQQIQTS